MLEGRRGVKPARDDVDAGIIAGVPRPPARAAEADV